MKQHRRIPTDGERFAIVDGARKETFFERHTAALLVAFLIAASLAATWLEGGF